MSYKNKNWLYKKYWLEKLTLAQIGNIYNITAGNVLYWFKKYGIKRRTKSECMKGRVFSLETRRKLSQARKGKTVLGPKFYELYYTPEKLATYMNKDWLYQKYWIEKLNFQQIAELCGVTKGVIYRWMKKLGIKARTQSEHQLGRKLPIEWKNKIIQKLIGRPKSLITREKLSNHRKLWHQKHPSFMKGENNPSWLGGISFAPYGIEFNKKLKQKIRGRDNYICQECYDFQGKDGRALDIHHIDYDKTNNDPNNLISLCIKCHRKVNNDHNFWHRVFKEKIKVITGEYSCAYYGTLQI